MCTYECNLAQGMDEEKATIEAENSMGDRNDVKTKLGQVHASFPSSDSERACARYRRILFRIVPNKVCSAAWTYS